jgi:sterol desaturase/sphingolipid hydroxylase (fatty acid hydroxylase superfamily)
MVSTKSIVYFLIINLTLLCVSHLQYIYLLKYDNLFLIFIIFLFRNIVFVKGIDFLSQNLKFINGVDRKKNYYDLCEIVFYMISYAFIESITHNLINHNYFFKKSNIIYDLILFIPISFVYEIIFDLIFYIMHKMLHSNKILYNNIHYIHHKYTYPTTIINYYMHPLDVILSNSIPQLITLIIIPRLSFFTYNLIIIYMIILEITGHLGKRLNKTSFTQFFWLPKLLKIELFIEDHDNHHKYSNCNYSKRFKLWDVIFNTWKSRD